jgi:hypothetical protein
MMTDTICRSLGVKFMPVGSIPRSVISYSGKLIPWNTELFREVCQER